LALASAELLLGSSQMLETKPLVWSGLCYVVVVLIGFGDSLF